MDMTLKTRRLTPAVGAEVQGIDLSRPIGAELAAQLYQAWLDADGVLLFRDQDLQPKDQVAFAEVFGEVTVGKKRADGDFSKMRDSHALPDYPQITRMSNKKDAQGNPLGRVDAGTFWHTDLVTRPNPGKASFLYSIEVPPTGGDTLFASMYKAYDALSEPMKKVLDGLQAVHSLAKVYGHQMTGAMGMEGGGMMGGGMMGDGITEVQENTGTHPVIRVHPDTGRKSIFVSEGFTTHIVGMSPSESAALLGFLFAHCTQPQFIYRHMWREHDLLMWDNRCTIHYAVADYKPMGRYMHRCTVKGDKAAVAP
jgi:taurine dioxygenase